MLNPEYDDFQPKDYDPSFTADINKRMHIPDHLAAMNGHEGEGEGADMKKAQILLNEIHQTSRMNVPDRIVILGENSGHFKHVKLGIFISMCITCLILRLLTSDELLLSAARPVLFFR